MTRDSSARRAADLTLPAAVHHLPRKLRRMSPPADRCCIVLPLTSVEPVCDDLDLSPEFLSAPGGQPAPTSRDGAASVQQLRWARSSDDEGVPVLTAAPGGGRVIAVVSVRGAAQAAISLPVRSPGAHMHPLLRRPSLAGRCAEEASR